MLKKTIVGAVAGLVLAAGAVSAEAVQPSHHAVSGKSSSAVAAAKRCHHRYPASVFTHTSLNISRHVQRQGQSNTAFVTVSSNAGTPRNGFVRVVGTRHGHVAYVRSGVIHRGSATVGLPRFLHRGRYSVQASFVPVQCSKFKRSVSGTRTYRVIRHRSHRV